MSVTTSVDDAASDLGEEAEVVGEDLEIRWPPAEFEMPLRKPVEHAGEVYDTLRLREPTDAEFEKIMAAPDGQRRRTAVALVTGIPSGAVAKMGVGDTVRAEGYLLSFFDIGRVIGVD